MKPFFTSICLLLVMFGLRAQDSIRKTELHGYVSSMQSVITNDIAGFWITDNLIHNRLNFNWYPTQHLTFNLELRNRFLYGDQVKFDADSIGYVKSFDVDNGAVDLSGNLLSEKSFFLNSMIDRLSLRFEKGKWNVQIGRQRINWGQTFAWNPNDIFNIYSYFDFDYEEKPGSDAIRVQYYNSNTSLIEVAIKLNDEGKTTAAGMYRFNARGYDVQVLGGILNEEDYVLGTGWSGGIKNVGFNGEMSYFHPVENFSDTSGVFIAALSFNYTFSNSLMLMAEGLYSRQPGGISVSNFMEFYDGPMTAKSLAFTEYSMVAQASYPITPLFSAGMGAMYFPKLNGYAFLPNLSLSLGDNLEMAMFMQSFTGKFPQANSQELEKQNITMLFLRMKGNF